MEVETEENGWVEDGYKHPVLFGQSWTHKDIELLKVEINGMAPGFAKAAAEGAASIIKEAYRKANNYPSETETNLEWRL